MKRVDHNIFFICFSRIANYLNPLIKYRSLKDSPNDEDQYFNYLVDNFVSVAADVCNSTLPGDETDYKIEIHRQSVLCAKSALKHYNNDEKNKVKFIGSSVLCYKFICII